jgi:DNA-nicking Smr family endonuclease
MSHGEHDDDTFHRAMNDVAPLEGPRRVPRTPEQRSRRRIAAPPTFHFEDERERGHAPGVNERQRAHLAAGRVTPGMRIDLHGFRADSADALVRKQIAGAVAAGIRCVVIVHGRGRHSAGGPVLREAVIQALTTAPTVRHVRAFCPALPADGGAGAMYVLLARGPR